MHCNNDHQKLENEGLTMCPLCKELLWPQVSNSWHTCFECGKGINLDTAEINHPVMPNTLTKLKDMSVVVAKCPHCESWQLI